VSKPYTDPPQDEHGIYVVDMDDWLATQAKRADPAWLRATWAAHGIDVDDPASVAGCADDQALSLWMDLTVMCKDPALQANGHRLLDRVQALYAEDE